ncbi:hypothetical protein T4D_1864 [Trichinella pseudospiralis]|uniref:Uncharacterized protein n=1 Tax=Trichinella pseudospiralis TaxID=6337 RepID=A0A0V1DNN8_TRIPS|nr:hypothetical protein T4D_1864 [Trichinella pseudospiralis]
MCQYSSNCRCSSKIHDVTTLVQLESCWLPPRYVCHYCTLRVIVPCWPLLCSEAL